MEKKRSHVECICRCIHNWCVCGRTFFLAYIGIRAVNGRKIDGVLSTGQMNFASILLMCEATRVRNITRGASHAR